MTAKAALVKAFLDGRILNVMNCAKEVGLTNIAREVPRCIERPFGVRISRVHRTGKSRYKVDVWWTDYRLNKDAEENKEGIAKMWEYLKKNAPKQSEIKTDKEAKMYKDAGIPIQTNKLFE